MKCKDCGAHLPYGAYGQIRCEFCNAPNYVPIPGEKPEAEEKKEAKKEPAIKKDAQKESSIKGLVKNIIIIGILFTVVLVVIGMMVTPSPDPPVTDTPKPTYYTPTTTRPPTTTWPLTTTAPPPTTTVPLVSIVSDSFNSNVNGWRMGSRSDDYATIEWSLINGKYRWDVKAYKGVNWHVYPTNIETFSDLHLTVEAQQISGAENAAYGAVFRLIDGDNFYYFTINNQKYKFALQYKDEWISLIDWTTSSAIRPWEVNKIEVIAEGSYFRLLINDQFISDVYDDRLTGGKTGLAIELYTAGDTGVFEFDNFEISTSAPSTTTPVPTTTAPPTTPPALGTRTNPAPIGYALSTEFEDWDDKYEAKLTVLEVIRGTDAWNLLIDANMFNSLPKEDHEYILAKIKFEYLSGPNIDTSYDVSTYSFNIISSGGKEYEVPLAVEPEPAIDASLYPGAFHEGWAAYEVAVEDSQPLLAFGRDYQGQGGIWFKLYEPPTPPQETTPPTTTPPPTTIPVMMEDNYPLEVVTYSLIEELPNYKIKVEGTVKNVGNEAVNRGFIIATFTLTHDRPSKEMRVFFIDDPFLPGEIQNFRFRSEMTKDVVESVKLSTGAG